MSTTRFHDERGVCFVREEDCNATYPAGAMAERIDGALQDADDLADQVRAIAQWDADKAEPRIDALERFNAAIAAALDVLRTEGA